MRVAHHLLHLLTQRIDPVVGTISTLTRGYGSSRLRGGQPDGALLTRGFLLDGLVFEVVVAISAEMEDRRVVVRAVAVARG